MQIRPFVLLSIVAGIAACERAMGALSGVHGDVSKVLRAQGPGMVRECRMTGSTRDATCLLSLPPAAQDSAAAWLGLGPVTAAGPEVPGLAVCAARLQAPADSLAVRGVTGRPASLRLADGAQLEYLFLLQRRSGGGAGCVAVGYAYG